MLRVILSEIPRGGRFKRFWLPSLDYIDKSFHSLPAVSAVITAGEVGRIAELVRQVRIGGTNKSSARGRLRDADVALIDQIESQPNRQLHFLDVGCSDGTASVETIELIQRRLHMNVSAYLQDRYIWVRSKRRWNIVEYISTEDDLVMVRCGCVGLAPAPKYLLLGSLTNRLVSAYLGLAWFRERMREVSRFPLLSPNVFFLPDLQISEGSVLTPNEDFLGRMDVVRVSNVLHFDYFSESEVSAAIANLVRYIRDRGLLLVSRNHQDGASEIERGTIWRLIAMTLVPVADFGGGSELKGLVAGLS
jgi:SAM-dependent methyltransferase